MRVRIDHETDAVYINLTDHDIEDSEEVADGVIVDYDATGNIVGLEILDASQKTGDPNTLRQFSFDLPKLAA
uniref:Uncharacterized protein YuzE n=1 Tax=Candidatus Kentrum sp. MB TaxID=2138164 RepID=A0A450X5W2_9GAMM|nr:MAG: Uncharacterized protein YuzE [Candidatus Kentron sp. MB]VFK27029.1 MAG: Uncharacterized protein YuzE [Candidatus Kentron sp. MB]VFK74933.1 MAG: Uncharacterized protein YuzE [Candidatus Kentron sp. MB]